MEQTTQSTHTSTESSSSSSSRKQKGAPGPQEKQLVLVLPQGTLFMPESPSPLNILDASWCLNLSLNWLLLSTEEQQQPCSECVLDIPAPRSLPKNEPDHFSEEIRQLVSVISVSGPHFITTSEKKKFAFATTDMHAALHRSTESCRSGHQVWTGQNLYVPLCVCLVGISQAPFSTQPLSMSKRRHCLTQQHVLGNLKPLWVFLCVMGTLDLSLEEPDETRCQSLSLTGTWGQARFQGLAPLTPQAEFTDLWSVSSFGVFLTCPASAHFPYYDAIYDARPFQRRTAPDVVAFTLFK